MEQRQGYTRQMPTSGPTKLADYLLCSLAGTQGAEASSGKHPGPLRGRQEWACLRAARLTRNAPPPTPTPGGQGETGGAQGIPQGQKELEPRWVGGQKEGLRRGAGGTRGPSRQEERGRVGRRQEGSKDRRRHHSAVTITYPLRVTYPMWDCPLSVRSWDQIFTCVIVIPTSSPYSPPR